MQQVSHMHLSLTKATAFSDSALNAKYRRICLLLITTRKWMPNRHFTVYDMILTLMCVKSVTPSFGNSDASMSISCRPVTKFEAKHS